MQQNKQNFNNPNTSSLTQEYIIAYLDILGGEEKIRKDQEKSLELMRKIYQETIIACQNKIFDIDIFSDNLIISFKIEEYLKKVPIVVDDIDKNTQNNSKRTSIKTRFEKIPELNKNIKDFFSFVAELQTKFFKNGLLVRGGISSGKFYRENLNNNKDSKTMVWGNTLIDAYHLENKNAIYPRVIISPLFIEEYKDCMYGIKEFFLNKDNDGLFFVTYLKQINNNYSQYQQICQKMLEETKGKIAVEQKIEWVKKYIDSKQNRYLKYDAKNEK